jgi:hypothetical protein
MIRQQALVRSSNGDNEFEAQRFFADERVLACSFGPSFARPDLDAAPMVVAVPSTRKTGTSNGSAGVAEQIRVDVRGDWPCGRTPPNSCAARSR